MRAESAIFPFTWWEGGRERDFISERKIYKQIFYIYIFNFLLKNFPILPCLLSSCYSRVCYCFKSEFTGIDKEQDCFIKSFIQLEYDHWENSVTSPHLRSALLPPTLVLTMCLEGKSLN